MIRLIFLALTLLFLFIFGYLNQEVQVSLSFLGGLHWGPISASYLVIGSFLIGIFVAILMTFPGWVKLRLERRKLERRIARLEEDLDRVRSESLKRAESNPPRQPIGSDDPLEP